MLCRYPIYLKNVKGIVPCGQCLSCRINKRREWTFRLCMEALVTPRTSWLTVTYNPAHVPMLPDNSSMTLNFDDHRLFMNRLRFKYPPKTFRFFTCGEYGENFGRPHFHICLFGLDGNNDRVDRSKILEAWRSPETGAPMGAIRFYPLEKNNIQYTCGYTVKKMTKQDDSRLFGRAPEDVRHSQGIGKGAIDMIAQSLLPYADKFDDAPSQINYDGKMWPLPRYMKEKLRDAMGILDEERSMARQGYKYKMSCLPDASKVGEEIRLGSLILGYKNANSLEFLYAKGNDLLYGPKLDRIEMKEKSRRPKGVL